MNGRRVRSWVTVMVWVLMPASDHNGAGGLSFADGHSEIKKWRSPLIESYGKKTRFDVRIDTADATWLYERTTKF